MTTTKTLKERRPLASLMSNENKMRGSGNNVHKPAFEKQDDSELIKSFLSNEGSQIEMEEIDMRLKALEDLLGKEKNK